MSFFQQTPSSKSGYLKLKKKCFVIDFVFAFASVFVFSFAFVFVFVFEENLQVSQLESC